MATKNSGGGSVPHTGSSAGSPGKMPHEAASPDHGSMGIPNVSGGTQNFQVYKDAPGEDK